ncbi:uncharacterized protein LOC124118100 isoform X2 [Haliotis rufescens]|uniref:uncharacterized protein LOC124118100 isoform X2 n=1 Tax=Haliotis rufescens TaxID=6454 RepID=UPI00201ED8DD|nr:uncharacterized protein LOC124118100 isoform X2 [Haliotis rufescens]
MKVENMKVTNGEDNGQALCISIFKPVIRQLRMNGFYLGRKQSMPLKCATIVLMVVLKFLTVFNAVRYSTIFVGKNKLDGCLTSSLAVFFFYSYVAYTSLTLTFVLPRHFVRFQDLLGSYVSEYGVSPYLKKFIHKIRLFTILFTALYLSFIASTTVGINKAFPSLKRHMAPFNSYQGTTVAVLYVFILSVVSLQLSSANVLFNSITFILIKEFKILSKKLKEDMDNFERIFGPFCQRHKRLSLILDQANNINTHFAFATYVFGIPMICFLWFGLIRGSLQTDELLFCSANLFTITALMIDVTVASCVLNDTANEPLQHIFRSNWASYSEGTTQKISLFVARLASEKVGYSVYGLFTIDRSTILMVVGTILTYAVVVLQVQPDSGAACNRCLTADNLNLTQLCS